MGYRMRDLCLSSVAGLLIAAPAACGDLEAGAGGSAEGYVLYVQRTFDREPEEKNFVLHVVRPSGEQVRAVDGFIAIKLWPARPGTALTTQKTGKVQEIDLEGKVVREWAWPVEERAGILSAEMLPDGGLLVAAIVPVLEEGPADPNARGRKDKASRTDSVVVAEFSSDGREVRRVKLDLGDGKTRVKAVRRVSDDRILVAAYGSGGGVFEADWDGQRTFSLPLSERFICADARPLENGNILAIDYSAKKVAEFDRQGNEVRSVKHPCPMTVQVTAGGNWLVGAG